MGRQKGYKMSKEQKERISIGNKNREFSVQHRKKLSEKRIGMHHSEETKKKIGITNTSLFTEEKRKKLSKLGSCRVGEKAHNWKGGVSREYKIGYYSKKYKIWRERVFKKNNYTCQKTRLKGIKLQAHHIKNFSQYPKLRFKVKNGITLSKNAHKEFHKKYGNRNNNEEQIQEFLRT